MVNPLATTYREKPIVKKRMRMILDARNSFFLLTMSAITPLGNSTNNTTALYADCIRAICARVRPFARRTGVRMACGSAVAAASRPSLTRKAAIFLRRRCAVALT